MTDNMKKFMEAASKDEALKAELQSLAESKAADLTAATIEFAAKHGFILTSEDFKIAEMTELSEDELEAVAGGVACVCPAIGGGHSDTIDCGCVLGGMGTDDNHPPHWCPVIGMF